VLDDSMSNMMDSLRPPPLDNKSSMHSFTSGKKKQKKLKLKVKVDDIGQQPDAF